ncbi:MAG TPA: YSC84-related protein [Burkholderiaceae bacterium]|jgi:lipid-binding SYLF domain-containing protein|nr:YSC84-related protein [Burkholderiaceae bacterium]
MSAITGNLKRTAMAALLLCGFALSSSPSAAASKEELDAHAREAIGDLYRASPAARQLAGRAAGMLVFPSVIKAGFWVGGEYGEGALEIGQKTVAYYNVVSASFGLQAGVQDKSVVLMFMTPDALAKFRESHGWKAGVDGSVALVTLGAGKDFDSETLQKPIVGFVFNNKGLMANLTLEGSKISLIDKNGKSSQDQARRGDRGGKTNQVATTAAAKSK